jgi:hypothetical protein
MCSPFRLRKTLFLLFFKIIINLSLYYVFQALPSLWDFFQLSFACHVHLKIGICSLNIMLINNVNSLTPWDSQNPYIPRLNKKQALWASSRKKENGNFQHYNILSAYEVKDETSTSSTYVSLVFYRTIRSSKNTCQKIITSPFFRRGSFEWFCTQIPMNL